jgi:hypothetical protein
VLTNGWELFADKNDAERQRNGVEFNNNRTPVYWYQNNDHYIAFYSKTYLGKTYSNYVPLSVANYHDLADLMERHKDNHLYIDREDVERPCKIYINDYNVLPDNDERKGKRELDELKALYDLSLLTTDDVATENGIITTGDFKDHALLGSHIKGCENLDIFLRTNIDNSETTTPDPEKPEETVTTPRAWTPIAQTGTCFGGNLHGDGHTISNLSNSLFGSLCGSVYNLGVTGTFTTAGIADTGDGYVENCWVKTSATTGFAADTRAVFGNPTNNEGRKQLVNCYYPESNPYTVTTNDGRGIARIMPDKSFYNGEVAYNLNGFYLKKRYYDGSELATGEAYEYLPANADGTMPDDPSTAHYPSSYALYTPQSTVERPNLGYVEHRFYDGDFRYAGGTIPESTNTRQEDKGFTADGRHNVMWNPIWPDDYLFFGQTLSYGYDEARTHQELPSVINKSDERLLTTTASNRVYRAPAYFRSKQMKVAYFNPSALFVQARKDDDTWTLHKDMTAIDLTGGNGDRAAGYQEELVASTPYDHISGGVFYPPLLDDDGLLSFRNVDLTRNLLAYTFAPGGTGTGEQPTARQKTGNVLSTYLSDEAYVELNATYRTVAAWDRFSSNIRGHWVQSDGTYYTATRDHMLVDLQDFNAPIGYTFDADHRMWYQRTPDRYVSTMLSGTPAVRTTTGWEDISLPFKVEVVTTDQKGEITHFYSAEDGSTLDQGRKGHEYWLREYRGGSVSATDDKVFEATLSYPAAKSTEEDKEYTNTFLWDYYYTHNSYDDANRDDYQENDGNTTYYKDARTYEDYPRMAAAKPYLIGFPGKQYYEFDLSGQFVAQNTAKSPLDPPAKLDIQTITFASDEEAAIGVSDDEMGGDNADGYTYRPSYMNVTMPAGTADTYTLSALGNSYDIIPTEGEAVVVGAFRPFFIKSGSGARRPTRSIVFVQDEAYEPKEPKDANKSHYLSSQPGRHKIVVTSTLKAEATVRIMGLSGQAVATFTIQPGETVETPIRYTGVYVVQSTDGQYVKKMAVK